MTTPSHTLSQVKMRAYDVESSPRLYARIAGALYLGNIVFGIFSEAFVRGRLIVPGNAAATAANITSMEMLWRLGIAAEFVALVFAIVLAMVYYVLLKPVSRELNLAATFLRLVSMTVQTVAVMNLIAALFPLGSAGYLTAFTPDQLHAMTALAIRSHAYGFGVALLMLGFCFLIHGYLIFRSGFLPRVLGILIQIGGLSYLTNSFALLLAPSLADRLFPAILLPAFVGEASLCVWLLVKGVDVDKWREANAAMLRRRTSAA